MSRDRIVLVKAVPAKLHCHDHELGHHCLDPNRNTGRDDFPEHLREPQEAAFQVGIVSQPVLHKAIEVEEGVPVASHLAA